MSKVLILVFLINLAGGMALGQQPKKTKKAPPPQSGKSQTAPDDAPPPLIDTSNTALPPRELKKLAKGKFSPPQGNGFYVAPIAETPLYASLIISDADNRSVTGNFLRAELRAFEAIILEAKKFAENEEAVGLAKPIYTRFFDKKAPSFIVDVGKVGNESHLYVTVKTLMGNLTVEAGTIKRGAANEAIFLDTILSRVQALNTGN
jgi:hypothetical protein